MKKTNYRVSKNVVKNVEATALMNAAAKLGVNPEQLETAHTEKSYVFKLKETGNSSDAGSGTAEMLKQYPFGLKSVEKSDEKEYQDAVREAMQHFNTFEANIKRVEAEEDEQHYVFTKVRG